MNTDAHKEYQLLGKQKAADLVHWKIRWNNPYTQPPDDQPIILAEMDLPRDIRPNDAPWPVPIPPLGSGYSFHFYGSPPTPIRRMSQEAKAHIRRRRMEGRFRAKMPLFAEAAIAAELSARPAYFAGQDPEEKNRYPNT